MTLTLDFSPVEEARLTTAAQQAGVSPVELAHKLVLDQLPAAPKKTEAEITRELINQWDEEDAKMTPEEIEEERKLWERFENNVNETRQALGMRQL